MAGTRGIDDRTRGRDVGPSLFVTHTPLRFAVIRVAINLALGAFLAVYVPRALGIDPRTGVAGLTAASGIAAWVEFYLLRRALTRRIGPTSLSRFYILRLWGAGIFAAAAASALRFVPLSGRSVTMGLLIVAVYGIAYFGSAALLGIPEAVALRRRVLRR
jgi:putative peptidoglycan lipid II flippase